MSARPGPFDDPGAFRWPPKAPMLPKRRSTPMFDDFSKRSKAVRAALDLANERGWGDIGLADIAQRRQSRPRRSQARVHLQDRHPPRLPGRGRRRGARPGEIGRRSAKPARPAVRYRHDAVRGDAALQAGAEAHRGLSVLPARRGRDASLRVARLAILDAGRRRRQARRTRRRAPRRRTDRHLRQGVPGVARRRHRRRSTRPWPRSTRGSARASACCQASRRPAAMSAASPADSCRAAGSAAAGRRLRPARSRHRQPAPSSACNAV